MSQEMDKQEAATPFKLEEARKRGQVARSMELNGFVLVFALLVGLFLLLPSFSVLYVDRTRWWVTSVGDLARDFSLSPGVFAQFSLEVLGFIGPVVLLAMLLIVAAALVYSGPVFSAFPLKPDFTKLNPASGFKKVFSRRTLIEAAKTVCKLLAFCAVAWLLADEVLLRLAILPQQSLNSVAPAWRAIAWKVSGALLLVMFLFVLIDLWLSKQEFSRQMRMSKRDIKDEIKRKEGDPEIKSKRKRAQKELLQRVSAIQAVRDADVVITNPSHVAVALKFRPETMSLPMVVCMGSGFIAQAMKLVARRYRVPIMRIPPLARRLLKSGGIGAVIPPSESKAVADVYRWVITLPGNKVMRTGVRT